MHGGLLARIIPPLHQLATQGNTGAVASLLRPFILTTFVMIPTGFVGGWFVGPPLVALAYGEALRPSGLFAGLTGVSVLGTMAALLFGQVFIAFSKETKLVLPWLIGLTTASLVVLLTTTTIFTNSTITDSIETVHAIALASASGIIVTTLLLMRAIYSPALLNKP